ncbi:TonB-dependent copper receptor [Acinetobacter sp. B10A]|uniref:TonB-dependent copper receptor n=1 Tax=Acinetobacter baretiae TaxID=2605383 RepID=UPI001B3CA0EB|nr:TonB-dependent copper receptor [Acinetobacter baretiae]MBF7686277.1 TonB-dependent copper receptor [Acinetobacter baretiae]
MSISKNMYCPLAMMVCSILYLPSTHAVDQIVQLSPIVSTAEQGNMANGLIVIRDPKQPTQPIPSVDGAAYLQNIMGFNAVKSAGMVNSDITFRGMFGSRIKVLSDYSENLGACGGRMDAPTSYISPERFDQMIVIKGPETVRFANPGSAATVLFDRKPVEFKPDQFYKGQVSTVMGSFGRLDHNIDVAMGENNHYLRLNANRSVSDDYQDGAGKAVHAHWEKWNTDLALGWRPYENTWLEATAGKANGQVAYAGRGMDGTAFARDHLGLRVQQQYIDEILEKIDFQINYNFNDHVMDNYGLRPLQHKMAMTSNVARKTLNQRLELTTRFGDWHVQTGLDHQYNSHSKRGTRAYRQLPRQKDMSFESYGLFSEASKALSEQHKLVLGTRVDAVSVKDFRATKQTFNQKRDQTLPSGFLRLESKFPMLNSTTYIGIGHVQRMPDYWEIFAPTFGNGSPNVFNTVKVEKTTQLDVGYQYQGERVNHWASAYLGYVQNFILTQYGASTNAMNVNAKIAGGEWGMGYALTSHIQTDVSAMYAWGENTTQRRALPQLAPLEARVNLRYVADQYSFGTLWRVVAAQHRYSVKQGNIVGYDLGPSQGFATWSINGAYRWNNDVTLALGIDNILNKNYSEHLNKLGNANVGFSGTEQINNIGRNYWARIEFKF